MAIVTRADIRQRIGEPDFGRGEAYFTGRLVKSLMVSDDRKLVTGKVSGSNGRLYAQTVKLSWLDDGRLRLVKGSCSCPVGHNCKHVAAVLLGAMSDLNDMQDKSTQDGNGELSGDPVQGWLKRFEGVDAKTIAKPIAAAPKRERLHYVMRATASGAFEIEMMRTRILKGGVSSKSPKRFTLDMMQSGGDGPKDNLDFLEPVDFGIIGKLQQLKRRGMESATGLRIHAGDIVGDNLNDLVVEIIRTGRARPMTIGHPDLSWGDPVKCRFQWRELSDATQQLIVVGEGGYELATLPLMPPLYVDLRHGRCGMLKSDAPAHVAHALVTMPAVPPKAAKAIVAALSKLEDKSAPLPRDVETQKRTGIEPVPVLRLFAVQGTVSALSAYGTSWKRSQSVTIPILRLSFDYRGNLAGFQDKQDVEYRDGDKLISIARDHQFEEASLSSLEQLHDFGVSMMTGIDQELFGLKNRRPNDYKFEIETADHLPHELDHLALDLFRLALPRLQNAGWRIDIDQSWPYHFYDGPLSFEASADLGGGVGAERQDWFSFALTAKAGEQSLDLLPAVLRIIETLPLDDAGQLPDDFDLDGLLGDDKLFIDLPDGSLAPVNAAELVPLINACLKAHALLGGFHAGEALQANKIAQALEGCGIPFRGGEALLALGRKLQMLSDAGEVGPPKSLHGTLRSYQKSGFGWLKVLSETGFGGVLADDMGLGKTIQALALLCQKHLEEGTDRPSLLVVPTSLLGNWAREAERFAPGLRLLVLHGATRHLYFKEILKSDLVITTYPLLHRDHKQLFAHKFEIAILDEAQAVKNPAAASAKRIREIDARQKLALTGTPIENNLQELWALYDWAVPGLLGNRKTFRETFQLKIEATGDDAARQKLAARIRPFLLRRSKEDVASDLPPKTEMNEIVTLEGAQRELYETIRVAMDSRVREAISSRGLSSTRITVLDALLKMRQVCCDPALVKLESAVNVRESAKRSRLMEMLEELLAEGRKVLIFSQFVEMLSLIEKDAKDRGIDYALLTGQTKNRQHEIERFQNGDVPLFLISLKAGGVGLNLTAADTVILYDPWWNPAVERQAMDRAHRIGQTKPVFVYKMIVEGSVEAAIQEMQAKKQALTDSLFEGADGGGVGIGEADIEALFAPLG